MKIAFLSLALVGQPVPIPVSDKVPVLNVEALCKATVDDAKAQGLTAVQSFSDCMKDEKQAQQQISTLWATSPSDVRNRCEGGTTSIGMQSYVELLTCLQAAIVSAHPELVPPRQGIRDRNKQ
ncbi:MULTISPECIES: hypothetical protein [Bradyrhizobium]|uniref:Uncharacterized protein n=1 Tax=Bradyrhizobium arachidis TaxID=858423 RepID=A0AAE7NW13_9BRAD|nr:MULTISPECIES: hypothetical protein [Bradyrhizobium]QOG18366.1 hypothetical protein FOM02_14480 [Bradyrhizobium sp. SEMIA]QOZ72302.1 hypothetical protein WN72_42925 [Bradyrhizobium arachidis]UFW48751.1 hypothetical protein BaraCB756_42040 [Bradyrhizobium arachidis]